ncbi:FtsK/SpoIIIE domain-containing protein [Streptomyces sp. NPDC017940]|uniref:FtsK/SpoIIIE domain-containing protein n=1 Tax=Streptomyces sp. NPDC017940 TaxID=3365017 RepID=UPI00378FC844
MAQPSTTAVQEQERSPVIAPVSYGVGLAMISYAAAQLLDRPLLLPVGIALAVLVAVGGSLVTAWHSRRARPLRELHAALLPKFGPQFTTKGIKIVRREGSTPTEITITYPPAFNERDATARAEVRDIVAKRIGGSVEATWQPPRRRVVCRVAVSPDTSDIVDSDTPVTATHADDTPERARLRSRATDVVRSIMGTTAKLADVAFDGDTPTMIEVTYDTTSRDLSLAFRQRVIMQLDSKLPGQWNDLWDLENDRVRFQLRPEFPTNVPYPLLHKPRKYEIPYAVTEQHQIEAWKLGSKNPHCLVVGPTGSGKTVFIRNLVVGARLLGIPVILCDPKRTEYLDFVGIPGVRVITDVEEIAAAITRTRDEMQWRYGEIEKGTTRKGQHGKVLLILDEFFVFKARIKEVWDEERRRDNKIKRKEHPCLSHWNDLIVLARTAEIHLVVGIQRPDAEFLTGLARDSLRKRISLDRTTAQAAMMMWDDARVGRDLPSVQGRAMATTDRGPDQVQVYRLLTPTDEDVCTEADAAVWQELVRRMRQDADGEEPLGFLGHLGTEIVERPPAAMALPAAPADAEEQATAPDTCPADSPLGIGDGVLVPVGIYDLEVGDHIVLDEDADDAAVEILDLHFGEADDGEDIVEITFRTEEGADTRELGVDATVYRKE